jgi:hypothetical protein
LSGRPVLGPNSGGSTKGEIKYGKLEIENLHPTAFALVARIRGARAIIRAKAFMPIQIKNMRYYLAARYDRRVELCGYREQLLSIGATVTSRWLDFRKKPSWSFRIARDDCEDLMAADSVIIFTEVPNTILATGGRHVEFGFALAHGKRMIIVGPRENVFHYLLPDSQIFATWNKAFATIRRQHRLCKETRQPQRAVA